MLSPLDVTPPSGNPAGYDISVLTESKAVVEKKGFVATGTLTYAAGEILEIEFPQYDQFALGEQVRVMIYAKGGIYVFESTVIARDSGSLIVLNPPENRRKFQDKRQDPRISVNHTGRLLSLFEYARKTERRFPDPPAIRVDNLSMSGAGIWFDLELPLQVRNQLHLELDIGFQLEIRTEIVHLRRGEQGILCGTRIIQIDMEQANKLRSYILKNQIETYYRIKEEKIREQLQGSSGKDQAAASAEEFKTEKAPHAYYISEGK